MDEGTNQIVAADSVENTEQLRADIEDTRAEMTQTINEIQERLSPEHLVGQVKETVREATIGKVERVMERVGETISGVTEPALEVAGRAGSAIKEAGSSVGNSVWKNPIPVAMIGLGVGMLLMRNFRGQRYSSTRRKSSQVPNYAMSNQGQMRQTQGSGTLDHMKETASDLANRSTQALSDLGTKAKNTASTVGTRFEQILHDNPLAIGVVAVAAGTAVGLVLPSTRFESEYIGETGERLVDRVEDVARGALDKVQDAARQMGSEGQQPPA
ncbi:MAG TPA: DUF3618 domain-containing protein [Pyrinomonadaceae bacterium]|jgi:ElaB/YqjD/DUF883 family membrane-anchored ribosome-binding protein|nr:DUF3618 domain-containing protein [Pyrinomonadaceae bacterium]